MDERAHGNGKLTRAPRPAEDHRQSALKLPKLLLPRERLNRNFATTTVNMAKGRAKSLAEQLTELDNPAPIGPT